MGTVGLATFSRGFPFSPYSLRNPGATSWAEIKPAVFLLYKKKTVLFLTAESVHRIKPPFLTKN